jgi:hypothetical protein
MNSPIFIVGMNGSGTTLMMELLNRHPAIYGYPHETIVLPVLLKEAQRGKFTKLSGIEREQWVKRRFFSSPALSKVLSDDLWEEIRKDENVNLSTPHCAFDAIMRILAERENKTVWSEKTPMHVKHIRLLSAHFPNARFIHMVRDPRACAASFNRRWGFHPLRTVLRWRECIRSARNAAQCIGEEYYLEVKYEDLLDKPEVLLAEIQQFLNLSVFNLNKMQSKKRQLSWFHDGEIKLQETNFQRYFAPRLMDRMLSIGGEEMVSLGYSNGSIIRSTTPSNYLRLTWLAHDFLIRGIASFKNEVLNSEDRRGWKVRYQNIVVAIKARLAER